MSQLSSLLQLLGAEIKVDFIPIAQQALAIVQKNPTPLGLGAAKLYVLAAVPQEALQAEGQLVPQLLGTVATDLQKWFASGQATLAAAGVTATAAAAPK